MVVHTKRNVIDLNVNIDNELDLATTSSVVKIYTNNPDTYINKDVTDGKITLTADDIDFLNTGQINFEDENGNITATKYNINNELNTCCDVNAANISKLRAKVIGAADVNGYKSTVDYFLLGDNDVEIDFEKDFAVLMKDNTIRVYKDIDWSEKDYWVSQWAFPELYGTLDSQSKFKQILSIGDISGATEGFGFYAAPDIRSKFVPVKDKIMIKNTQSLSFCQFDDYSMFDYSLLVNPWSTFCGSRISSKTTFDFPNLTEANLIFYSAIFEQSEASHSGDSNTAWDTLFRGWFVNWEKEFVINAPVLTTSGGLFQNAVLPGLRFFDFSFPELTKATSMFRGAIFTDNPALEISLPKVTNVDEMFAAVSFNDGLLYGSGLNLPEVTSAKYMFTYIANLTLFRSLSLPKLEYAKGMFKGCRSLRQIDLCTFGPLSMDGGIDMFANCLNLETIKFNLTATTKAEMFNVYLPNLRTLEITGLKCNINLAKQVNISVNDVKFLFDNAQTVTNKTVTLPKCIEEYITDEIKTTANQKGWTISYSNVSNTDTQNKLVRQYELDQLKAYVESAILNLNETVAAQEGDTVE